MPCLAGIPAQTRYNIDDPLDSSAIHFGCGSMGTLLLGLLARPAYVQQLTGYTCGGLVYSGGRRGGILLGLQLLGESVQPVWATAGASGRLCLVDWMYQSWLLSATAGRC